MKVHGRWVYAVDIDDVDHILLRFDKSYHPTYQGTFKLRPRERCFLVEYPMEGGVEGKTRLPVNLQLNHFPILGNFATTGHKLQGKTMKNLIIAEWRICCSVKAENIGRFVFAGSATRYNFV
jgi:hypothetical protein